VKYCDAVLSKIFHHENNTLSIYFGQKREHVQLLVLYNERFE
jgi:hypothetical protein